MFDTKYIKAKIHGQFKLLDFLQYFKNVTFRLLHHHHHLAASAEIEFTTLFQYVLSDIATKRSSLEIEVSLQMVSGKVSFRDRLCDDGSLQRTKDDASSSEALEQCPANWTLRFISTVLLRINAGGIHLIFDIFGGAFIQGRRLYEGGVYTREAFITKYRKNYNSIYQRQ